MRDDHSDFEKFLTGEVHRYRGILEDRFGPCDPKFVFGSIKKTLHKDDKPQIHFPNDFHLKGGCVADIHISERPWKCRDRGLGNWQVAHECVHLLDPSVSGTANVLEEGLAAWFQDDQVRGIPRTREDKPYEDAKELVCRCMPGLPSAVKKIRSLGVRIREITADRLAPCLPNADRETVERLCAKFEG